MQYREEILAKAVEIAKLKLKDHPVILFCKDDTECASVKGSFEKTRIFGEGSNTAELLGIVKGKFDSVHGRGENHPAFWLVQTVERR